VFKRKACTARFAERPSVWLKLSTRMLFVSINMKPEIAKPVDILSALARSFPEGSDVYKLPNGKRIIIECRDIVTSRAEALVSADSSKLPMSGGVSKSIRKAAGSKVERETKIYSPIAPGKITVTSAGKLPARFIFHAVTIEFSRASGSKAIKDIPSRDLLHQLLEGCFAEADKYRVKSIAFPLLRAGFGGLEEDVSLSTIFHDLLRRLSSGPNSVDVARIVIWNGQR